jgi:hypothetical protein
MTAVRRMKLLLFRRNFVIVWYYADSGMLNSPRRISEPNAS